MVTRLKWGEGPAPLAGKRYARGTPLVPKVENASSHREARSAYPPVGGEATRLPRLPETCFVEPRFVLTSCPRGLARVLASLPRYYATSETAHRLLDDVKRLLPVVALLSCFCPSGTG